MRWMLSRGGVLFLIALQAVSLRADDTVAAAYEQILRGDFRAGRTTLEKIDRSGDPEVARAADWLAHYSGLIESRAELRKKSYDWNVEQAHTAQDAGRVYLALNFAFQAASYAEDREDFAGQDWVRDLLRSARDEAAVYEREGKWSKALAYYMLMERVSNEAPEVKALKKNGERHARLEIIYDDKEAIERRMKDVNRKMPSSVWHLIEEHYYEKPDYRKMGLGALENLIALANTTKVQKALDGLANSDARALFIDKIDGLKKGVKNAERFTRRDLLDLFNRVQDANATSVQMPDALLIVEYVEGALGELDEFTSMIWPADAPEFDKLFMGGFEGVGIQLGVDERTGRLKVSTPLEDSPALEAGVQPGDLIVEVDGRSTAGWTTEDAVREIMGPSGSKVTLTMFRPSAGKEIDFDLHRRKIVLRTVRGLNRLHDGRGDAWNYMLDKENGVAYVRLTGFHTDSALELREALEEARDQGMRGLILDLRYNPGGLLDAAVNIVSLFVPKGEVVSTRGLKARRERVDVTGHAPFGDLPLLVLVNDHSASASEIFAGALKDHNRASVVGQRTFGKGSVQKVLQLGEEARLKLTNALYYLPHGETPHRGPDASEWGVDPNVAVELMPKEGARVIQRQNESMIIREGDKPKDEDVTEAVGKALDALKSTVPAEKDDAAPLLTDEDFKLLESDPTKAPDVDPQLETALLQMRIKLAGNLPWPRKVAAVDGGAKNSQP